METWCGYLVGPFLFLRANYTYLLLTSYCFLKIFFFYKNLDVVIKRLCIASGSSHFVYFNSVVVHPSNLGCITSKLSREVFRRALYPFRSPSFVHLHIISECTNCRVRVERKEIIFWKKTTQMIILHHLPTYSPKKGV